MNVGEKVPRLVWFTSVATHDNNLLEKLKLGTDLIHVFDKGYIDYKAFERFCDHDTAFLPRIKNNTAYKIEQELQIEESTHSGVVEDKIIKLYVKESGTGFDY